MSLETNFENWRDVGRWEGYYQVSALGGVRSLPRTVVDSLGRTRRFPGVPLTPYLPEDGDGYLRVIFNRNGDCEHPNVHRLMAETFLGAAPFDGAQACHDDGNKLNNVLSNLRWDTPAGNVRDTVRHGTNKESRKTHCPRNHELNDWNITAAAKRRGHRRCLACARACARYRTSDTRFSTEADRQYQRLRGTTKGEIE